MCDMTPGHLKRIPDEIIVYYTLSWYIIVFYGILYYVMVYIWILRCPAEVVRCRDPWPRPEEAREDGTSWDGTVMKPFPMFGVFLGFRAWGLGFRV